MAEIYSELFFYLYRLHEVKGFMEDDAAVKLKVAAETFWWFQFKLVKKDRGNSWLITNV